MLDNYNKSNDFEAKFSSLHRSCLACTASHIGTVMNISWPLGKNKICTAVRPHRITNGPKTVHILFGHLTLI